MIVLHPEVVCCGARQPQLRYRAGAKIFERLQLAEAALDIPAYTVAMCPWQSVGWDHAG